jgi:hypothetical protein
MCFEQRPFLAVPCATRIGLHRFGQAVRTNTGGGGKVLLPNRVGGAPCTGPPARQGAHIEAEDRYRWTPLTVAVRTGQGDTVRLLLQRGAGIPGLDVYGEAVLTMALRRGYTEIARLLQEAGANEPPIVEQARRTGVNAIPFLRLEKATYRRGGHIRFWVGMRPLADEPISQHLWSTTDFTSGSLTGPEERSEEVGAKTGV